MTTVVVVSSLTAVADVVPLLVLRLLLVVVDNVDKLHNDDDYDVDGDDDYDVDNDNDDDDANDCDQLKAQGV